MRKDHNFFRNEAGSSAGPKLTVAEVLRVLNRRKLLILSTLAVMSIIALFYNSVAPRVYQASVLIKKEKPLNERGSDDLRSLVLLRTPDEIETEIEILKTRPVVARVADALNLSFSVQRIEIPGKPARELNIFLWEYQQRSGAKSSRGWPLIQFSGKRDPSALPGDRFFAMVENDLSLSFWDQENHLAVRVRSDGDTATWQRGDFTLNIIWPGRTAGSRIFFRMRNSDKVVTEMQEQITVNALRKTSLFQVGVKAPTPFMAREIANELGESFRETRLEQKRKAIRYSYDFVDEQLADVSRKLREAENELSDFKSQNRILQVDENSRKTLNFLTNLEAEKIKTELELAENQNRIGALGKELDEKGYFDQTYLTPNRNDNNNSPFSVLMRQLADAEIERLALLERRTENHPDVIAADKKIAEIREKLAGYNRNTISAYNVIINSLKKKRDDLENLIRQYSQQARAFPANESKLLELTRNRNVYEKMFVLLLDKREEMRIAELSKLQDIVIVAPATTPLQPVSPRKFFNLAVALILGTLLSLLTVIFLEFRSGKIRTLAEIEEGFHMPVLGVLPKYDKPIREKIESGFSVDNHLKILTDGQLGFKEQYRILRTRLGQLFSRNNVVLITSCEENTGKTTVVANFAISLAMAGKKILAVDCDLRKPRLGAFFNLGAKAPGLIDYLKLDIAIPHIYRPLKAIGKQPLKLHVIPAGGSVENSSELLDSPKLRRFLKDISPFYDYVLIDTPPITRTVDGIILGNVVKELILVIRPDLTQKDVLSWAIQDLRQFEITVLGSVVNGCDLRMLPSPYRYGYGYGDSPPGSPSVE